MSLPGTPRDLPTMEAHLQRASAAITDLWRYDNMMLRQASPIGNWREQAALLAELRQDLAALRSCVTALAEDNDTLRAKLEAAENNG